MLTPDNISVAIKVNARPLTVVEWARLLADHGLVVDHVATAPMALLQPRRLIADESLYAALRFAKNLLIHRDARRRVARIRRTFRRYRERLIAVAIIAHKPTATAEADVRIEEGASKPALVVEDLMANRG